VTQAQTEAKDDPELRHANELVSQLKLVEAMPLFEELAADHPSNYQIRERWAWFLFAYAATLPDPEQRKKGRVPGRTVALQAKNLGDPDPILLVMLETPDDGAEAKFSDRKDVDQAMKAAEADFAHGELDKAREGYLRVVLIDPNNYEAAIFVGDTYFKQHVNGSAGEWFSRAIQIDPNRETAYRYWADALEP
jgi:tetratricopeptide (TPR) repeat protein